jgi:protein-tyrosine phosphatase
MAEALLRKMAKEENLAIDVRSAGVSAIEGMDATEHAKQVLCEKGIEPAHRTQMVTEELMEWADLILTMTTSHKQFLLHRYPQHMDKIFTLKEYANPNPEREKLLKELDQLYVEMECKRLEWENQAKVMRDEEKEKKLVEMIDPLLQKEEELQEKLSRFEIDYDIADPFGGSLEVYRRSAQEIEEQIKKCIEIWKKE